MAMNRLWVIFLLLPCVLLGQEKPSASAGAQTVTLSFPASVKPETAFVQYGFRSGTGISMGALPTRAGVHDYRVVPLISDFGAPDSLNLVVYVPGYRIVASEFSRDDLRTGRIFVPSLVPLPTVTLNGRLIDSTGKLVKGEYLGIAYSFTELMGHFGYADGMVPDIQITDTRSNDNGEFTASLPALLDDPFFQETSTPGSFHLRIGKGARDLDSTLNPESFQVQKAYELLTVRKTLNGTVSGKLGKEFFRQNNLSGLEGFRIDVGPPESVVRPIPSITAEELRRPLRKPPTSAAGTVVAPVSWYSALVNADGTFELRVPPGTYDVKVWSFGDDRRMSDDDRSFSIARDVILEEGKQRTLDLP